MRGWRRVLSLNCSAGFFLLLCISPSSSSPPPAVQGSQLLVCGSRDRDALTNFSTSLEWGVRSWSPRVLPNCCRWRGVRCGVSSSSRNSSGGSEARVVGLELGKIDLKGAVVWKTLLGLDELRALDLSQNSLSGVITPELFQLRQLEVLDLSSNQFEGSIPDAFDSLRKLRSFSARSNHFTGGVPPSLSSCSMLSSLDLGHNNLSGRIMGLDCTRLVRLRTLRLDSNSFVGQIPRNLASCGELETLNLARNRFHGRVPWWFKNLRALSSLSLSGNGLSNVSQALAALSGCRNLSVLVLSGNFAGETMPGAGIINGGFEGLKALVVAGSALYGRVPSWLRSCADLRLLDLSSNRFHETVPPWLGAFPHFFYLDLSNNSFVGALPHTLANLSSLTSPDFSIVDNTSVELPLHARRNRGQEVLYSRFSRIPPTLDLSQNGMGGPILEGFGRLVKLTVLDLSNNSFSGSIPQALSGMSRLEYLDLSHNGLSGSIPPSLDNLTFLSVFSVAYNRLQGRVPESRQFATFSDWSYEGNPELCGGPLGSCTPNRARPPPVSPPPGAESEDFKITFMPLPYGIGVLIGFIPTVVCRSYCAYRGREKKERRD